MVEGELLEGVEAGEGSSRGGGREARSDTYFESICSLIDRNILVRSQILTYILYIRDRGTPGKNMLMNFCHVL